MIENVDVVFPVYQTFFDIRINETTITCVRNFHNISQMTE